MSISLLAVNGVGLSAFAFYQHDQYLQAQINERQNTIQHTFTIIHNGPLQTLAYGLKHMRAQDIPYEQLVGQFEKLTAFTAVMRYSSSNWQTSFLNVEDLLNRVQLRLVCQPFLL
ncbi:hypothetical protein [Nostoc sp. ChiVER01]|uniref:hypothetical protein n=1 Tax=unclassified Nostoc TaxID=2593658 RepID=UPI002AD1F1AE|nr:hypothetical protein [Nostoc sp. ChiVER01]MDZ8224103.1 hypothetical protein [Nostoc sp. ChiVER01]